MEQTFMDEFVNRDNELAAVDNALKILTESERLLSTPVIGFYGIRGIGKTMLLSKIAETCKDKKVRHYMTKLQDFTKVPDELNESFREKEPVVVILDDWDVASPEQLRETGELLSKLAEEDANLFIVLAGKSKDAFDRTSSLSRKITRLSLSPFDRKHCEAYIDRIYHDIEPTMRHFVFEWTRGYPVAMKVMIDAMRANALDPRREHDRGRLLSIMTERIINSGFFADEGSDKQKLFELYSLFSVLSVPRRFNVTVMQDIIENYAPPRYKRKGPLAYVGLPQDINKILHVLDWEDASYHIDISVRNIFLLKFSIERYQEYRSIHTFLANLNRNIIGRVNGPDCIRYIREYCYHLAKSGTLLEQAQMLQEELEQLLAMRSPDEIIQFYREFWRDEELKEALGEDTRVVITVLRGRFLDLYNEIPGEKRIGYLQRFFLCSSLSATGEDFVLLLEQGIGQVRQEETPELIARFCTLLASDSVLRTTLGKDFQRINALLGGDFS